VESRFQQEQSALKEAQDALEHERSAQEEAQGQLQWEHAALEEERATLKLRDAEITRLTGEVVQEGVSYEELRQDGKEKHAAILKLQQAVETSCIALKTEKKQVEGKSPLSLFCLLAEFVEIRSRLNLRLHFQACGGLSGHQRPRLR
jgi:chromosome segregation ATPase